MKKLFILAAFVLSLGLCVNANAEQLPLDGTYVNDAGTLTIAKAVQNGANYDVLLTDKSGQCKIMIVASTNNVTAEGKNGAVFHPNTIVAVEGQTYPNFSLWPEDQTVRLAEDALPLNELDPACQAFKNNMVFTRQQ